MGLGEAEDCGVLGVGVGLRRKEGRMEGKKVERVELVGVNTSLLFMLFWVLSLTFLYSLYSFLPSRLLLPSSRSQFSRRG